MENNEKQNIDIAVIKNEVSHIKKEVGDIKENHLKSIYKRLIGIERRLAYGSGGIAILVILVGLFIKFYK